MIYQRLKVLYYLCDALMRHNQFLLILYVRKVLKYVSSLWPKCCSERNFCYEKEWKKIEYSIL